MTQIRDFAVQIAATLAISGFLGAVMYGLVDYAMTGVVA